MKKYPRFNRQFSKAATDFPIFAAGDHFLVPVDADFYHLALIICVQKKNSLVNKGISPLLVHFHAKEEPSPNTEELLKTFCKEKQLSFICKKVADVTDRNSYKRVLLDTAIQLNCNKIALPDSLDFLDATIISNMAFEGIFDGASVIEKCIVGEQDDNSHNLKEISFVRPFCYLTDEEINKFGEMNKFPNQPTGVKIAEDDLIQISRLGVSHLLNESSNIRMNLFNSQFNVQKKYIGSSVVTDDQID